MDLKKVGLSNFLEWIVFLLVIFSTITINLKNYDAEIEELEITYISGTVELTTESSMDALGLDDFRIGALATIEMNVNNVVSNASHLQQMCDGDDCTLPPKGIQLNGTVNITNLKDHDSIGNSGSTGRIEGTLNLIHLSEYSKPNFISREWISIDWEAGDASINLEIILNHDPPKWSPQNRFSASFIDITNGVESRSGPLVIVHPIVGQIMNAQGCLPDTFFCDNDSTNINLKSTFQEPTPPLTIPPPPQWIPIQINSTIGPPPLNIINIRDYFELNDEAIDTNIFCPTPDQNTITSKSWNTSDSDNIVIAPMSIWLEVFYLNTNTFSPSSGGKWTEVDFTNSGCANLENKDGSLLFGFYSF